MVSHVAQTWRGRLSPVGIFSATGAPQLEQNFIGWCELGRAMIDSRAVPHPSCPNDSRVRPPGAAPDRRSACRGRPHRLVRRAAHGEAQGEPGGTPRGPGRIFGAHMHVAYSSACGSAIRANGFGSTMSSAGSRASSARALRRNGSRSARRCVGAASPGSRRAARTSASSTVTSPGDAASGLRGGCGAQRQARGRAAAACPP